MRKRIILSLAPSLILPLALSLLVLSCASKGDVNTQPKLTPEQVFELVKSRAVTATDALGLLISELEKKEGVSIEKLRIWKNVFSLMTELNAELEDYAVIDLSNREAIGRAVNGAIATIDSLLLKDVGGIVDVKLKAEISRGIQLVRVAVAAIQVLLPPQEAK